MPEHLFEVGVVGPFTAQVSGELAGLVLSRWAGLLRFSTVPEGPASPLCRVTRTPFALMQQCPSS
jgi:hypothetical protein